MAAEKYSGIGVVAHSLLSPIGVVSTFINTTCIIFGTAFTFAAILRYVEHRRNPLVVTLSTVFFYLVAGLVLLALPFVTYLYQLGQT